MANSFDHDHPWPDQAGFPYLYKFTRLDDGHPERLEELLVGGRLFHAWPSSFNDPWECRPSVHLPEAGAALSQMRSRIIRILSTRLPRKEAERQATETLVKRDEMRANLLGVLEETYGSVRVCSLAGDKKNHLLWAHYAAAHTGVCIEFDATTGPFPLAYRVKYQADYPTVEYPIRKDKTALVPLLTKSVLWKYEQEFRSLINPDRPPPFENDGTAAIIPPQAVTGVFLGVRISTEHREQIVSWIEQGPFTPQLWRSQIDRSSYTLRFSKYE